MNEPTIEYAQPSRTPAPASPQKQRVPLWILSLLAWAFIGLVLFGVIGGILTFGITTLPVISPILAVIVLTALAAYMQARRRAHSDALFQYVHQAVRLNLPLPPMLSAAEQAETGRLRVKIRKLRQRLQDGLPLARALSLAAPGTPGRSIAAVDAAEQFGRLPEALGRLTLPRATSPRAHATSVQVRWYPVVLLVLCAGAINGFMIFVAPKYQEIFADFNLTLPPVTAWFLRFWSDFGILLSLVLMIVFALFCGQMAAQALAPRAAGAGPIRPVLDRLLWIMPVARGVVLNRGLGDAFHVVADALEVGAALPRALSEAASVPSNAVVRQRVANWAAETATGTSTADAARKARMPDLVCGMLAGAQSSAQAPAIFRFLARYYESRFNSAAILLQGAALPLMSLVFGLIVGAVVMSVMLPLLELIDSVSVIGFR